MLGTDMDVKGKRVEVEHMLQYGKQMGEKKCWGWTGLTGDY